MLVKIARYFAYPDIRRQTPRGNFQWNGIAFTEEDVEECDYLVILDSPKKDFSIRVNPENILHLSLEPPNEVSLYRQYGGKQANTIYNQFDTGKRNVLSHGALPWHVDKDYDYLKAWKPDPADKKDEIVWVTSNQRSSKGHRERMDFLDGIRNLDFVKLYGRGIQAVDSKWDVLAPAKYAIAYENIENPYNWTEKIADCFLAYTLPLYFGCTQIDNFFPKESFIQLDPKDKHAHLLLKETVNSGRWERSLEAITEARELVLDTYQLFPFLYSQIMARQAMRGNLLQNRKQLLHFTGGDRYFDNFPWDVALKKQAVKIENRIKARISKKQ